MAKKQNSKEIIFTGVLTYNRKETTDYKGNPLTSPVNKLSFKGDDMATLRKDVIEAGVDPNNAFCPKWVKDETCNYVNLKSKFDIPVLLDDNKTNQSDVNLGAKCTVKITVKPNGNIYPVSFVVEENGAEFNPFEGM